MKLLIVLASVREGRAGKQVADWFVAQAEKDGQFEVELVDLKELKLSYELPKTLAATVENGDYEREEDRAWSAKVGAADAMAFVTPEYNHGYPASLKNAVDHLYSEWHNKPVAFVGYGSAGAPYSQAAFSLVATHVKMDLIGARVGIPQVWAAFDESGVLAHAAYHEQEAKAVLQTLAKKITAG